VTWGVSLACRTSDLNPDADWTKKAMANLARAMHGFWTRNGFDPIASAQAIPAVQTQSRPGFSTHGEAQPADRSDAWTRHPRRRELEAMLIANIKSLSVPTPSGVDPIMQKPVIMRNRNTGMYSVFYQGSPFRVDLPTMDDVNRFKFFGVEDKGNQDPWFWKISSAVKTG